MDMRTLYKAALCTMALCTGMAQASTLDYRHDYIDSGKNKDQLKVAHKFDNGIGVALTVKWASGNRPFEDFVGNGHKESINYRYKVNDFLTLTPGFSLNNTDDKVVYKPGIAAKVKLIDSVALGGKYNYEYTNSNKGLNKIVHKAKFYITEKFGKIKTKVEYIYKTSPFSTLANNKKHKDEYNISLAYQASKVITPYIEVGNVSGSKKTNERQTRYRVGVKYTF